MTEKLMTISEVAEMLGLTKTGVYQMIYYGRIPCIKISKKAVRFRPSDIEAWLEGKTRQAVEVKKEPISPVRRSPGRPRKNGNVSSYVDNIVNAAKKEVLK